MIIKLPEGKYFGELKPGDVFKTDIDIYLKIAKPCDQRWNAVHLGDDILLAEFSDDVLVEPYMNSELVLKP